MEVQQSLQRLQIPSIYGNAEVFSRFTLPNGSIGQEASMDIPSGTPILSEKALFIVKDGHEIKRRDANRPEFQALSSPAPATIRNRFIANSYGMDDGKSGIFVEASRFNHSCIPNAHFSWNTNTEEITIHAVIDIPLHTEIFINYRPNSFFKPTTQRQRELQDDYGFICNCSGCQPIILGQPDTIIDQLRLLKNQTTLANPSRQSQTTLEQQRLKQRADIETFIHVMSRQAPFYPQLANMYDAQVKWYRAEIRRAPNRATHQKEMLRQEALQVVRNKLDLDVRCTGPHSSEVEETLRRIRAWWSK